MESGWFFNPIIIWFILGLVALVGEVVIPGFFLVFFGFGAWVTAGLLFIFPTMSPVIQLVIFLVASIGSLAVFRRKLKSLLYGNKLQPDNMPDTMDPQFIGHKVEVVEAINPPHSGRVLVNGATWQALSDTPIEKGLIVEITGREGLTFKVKSLD